MAPKAQKEPSWIEEPTNSLGTNEYTNSRPARTSKELKYQLSWPQDFTALTPSVKWPLEHNGPRPPVLCVKRPSHAISVNLKRLVFWAREGNIGHVYLATQLLAQPALTNIIIGVYRVRETFMLNQLKSTPSQLLPVFPGFNRLKLVTIHMDRPISYNFFKVPANFFFIVMTIDQELGH